MTLARRLLASAGGFGAFTEPDDMTQLGWTNVKTYGATGNGSTDDTAAIASAIASLPASGGVLFFPPGTYKTSGGFTLSTPCVVLGSGGGGGTTLNYPWPGASNYDTVPAISQVICTSATAVLFSVAAHGVSFSDLWLLCTAATPTNGAAIQTVSGGGSHAIYTGLTISGFYIDLDIGYGREWDLTNCFILDWAYDGVRHANAHVPDEGEANVTACHFVQSRSGSNAAYDIISGGGIRIANCQFVGIPPVPYMVLCSPAAATSNLWVEHCSMEGWSVNAVKIAPPSTIPLSNVFIQGNEIQGDGTGSSYREAILVVGTTSGGECSRFAITGNIMTSAIGGYYAINLTHVTDAAIVGNIYAGSWSGLLTTSGCTNVNSASNYS